ncbi:uncharacterized protein LOC131224123 [Magnolia sinica]|uniref:uncharacterized protein LOC131224123 n=1 Tax=Magnolia sinica TaxID=86752 RepID=UPI00265B18BD|nr:uncharacterized protein LOC131224123 [Magnolia sinica]
MTTSLIYLIPKISSPKGFSDFLSISLCNCVYKILSKIIAARLSKILPSIISPEQGAFIQGRAILENIALAQELFREINKKVRGGNIVLKLDMEKAYDRVEWGFFKSTRGLRQGDPLSLGLFIILAEVLSRGLKRLVEWGFCQPFKLMRGCPLLSHLLYVDDTLLFLNGGLSSLINSKAFLVAYQAASGQLINHHKSSFFSSNKISSSKNWSIERLLGISKSSSTLSYLGVPIAARRLILSDFQPLIDKVDNRFRWWQSRFLSQAGRVVLFKDILASIPVHTLAAVHLSAQVLSMLEKCFANFYRGWDAGKKKLHWKSSKVISCPHDEEGLGIMKLAEGPDAPFWPHSPSGAFSVSSAWSVSRSSEPRRSWARCIWHGSIPPQMSNFLWRPLNNAIPVDSAIQARGIPLASKCVCCQATPAQRYVVETLPHLLLESELAVRAWNFLGSCFGINVMPASSLEARVAQWCGAHPNSSSSPLMHRIALGVLMWVISKARNAARFNNKPISISAISAYLSWWIFAISGTSFSPLGIAVGLSSPHHSGGGVCRDENDTFMFAFVFGYEEGSNTYAELHAVLDGISGCISKGFPNVEVKSDSQLVIGMLSSQRFLQWTDRASRKYRVPPLSGLALSIIVLEIWINRNSARFEDRSMPASRIISSNVSRWLKGRGLPADVAGIKLTAGQYCSVNPL